MAEKEMTIARGLTRLKTIKARLTDIVADIARYGAWMDQKKHPLGEVAGIEKSINIAKEKIKSLHQKHTDLIEEYVTLKFRIDRANMNTTIVIQDKPMSLHKALTYKREVQEMIMDLIRANNSAIQRAEKEVNRHDEMFATAPDEAKKLNKANVVYLVPQDKIKALNDFIIEFMTEVDGELNSINALTEL